MVLIGAFEVQNGAVMQRIGKNIQRSLAFESLESRQLLALTVTIDYTYDTNNFFDTTAKRDLLQLAADEIAGQMADDLTAISPSGSNSWSAQFFNPATGSVSSVSNLNVAADEIIIYAGGRSLGGSLGQGGPGGYSASGSGAWLNTLATRGETGAGLSSPTDFGPWGGAVTFDTGTTWHFGETTSGLSSGEYDFYSVALHEVAHLFGFGTSDSFDTHVNGSNEFTGANALDEYDGTGNIPLTSSSGHWASGTTDDGQETAMDPSIASGIRKDMTRLDLGGLADIGWEIDLSEPAEIKINSDDVVLSDWFGYAVDIDGDWAAVGAIREDDAGTDAGAVYIFNYQVDTWVQVAKITASDGASLDNFGNSVAISGDTVVVGAYLADGVGSNAGAAYVFEKDFGGADNWGQRAKLTPSGAYVAEKFGISVDIDVDTVAVGAYFDTVTSTVSGAAYVFNRDQGGTDNWGEAATLLGSDTASYDKLGTSVSVSGDYVLVGASHHDASGTANTGAAYLFERDSGGSENWGEINKFTSSDIAANDQFGYGVAVSGTTVAISARLDDDGKTSAGSAYIFEKDQGGTNNWGEVTKVTANDPEVGAWFGDSIDLDGDILLVGASRQRVGSSTEVGSAYTFGRDQGGTDSWGLVENLTADDQQNKDRFGISVAISGTRALAGAYLEDPGVTNGGSVYIMAVSDVSTSSLGLEPPSGNEPESESNVIQTAYQKPGGCGCGGVGCPACSSLTAVDSIETPSVINPLQSSRGSGFVIDGDTGTEDSSRDLRDRLRRFQSAYRLGLWTQSPQFVQAVDAYFATF